MLWKKFVQEKHSMSMHAKIDTYSYQVYSDTDERFWFRLVREPTRDLITDFFIGSFAKERSGPLLVECYKTLSLAPSTVIAFLDILSRRHATPEMLEEAQELYSEAGIFLLLEFGAEDVYYRVEESNGKFNLILADRKF